MIAVMFQSPCQDKTLEFHRDKLYDWLAKAF